MVQLAASHLWLPEGNPSYCIRRQRFVSARGRSRVNWASSPSLPRLFPDFYGVLLQPMDPSQCWARSSSLASWGQVVNNHQQCHLTAGLDNFHPPRDPVDSSSRIRFCHGWCLQRHWKLGASVPWTGFSFFGVEDVGKIHGKLADIPSRWLSIGKIWDSKLLN